MKKQRAFSVKYTSRHELVARMRSELERRGFPRLQMMLLVALTGGAGFLASYGLLHAGVEELAVRYGLAVVIAYLVFLLLLWLWLRTSRDSYEGLEDVVAEIVDAIPDQGGEIATPYHGSGGRFGGGGSTARWEESSKSEPLVELPEVPDVPEIPDVDEAAIPLAVLLFVGVIVVTALAASASVVYSAPILFAELMVDGLLSATLYRRLRRMEPRHWLQTALRRTLVPFGITAVVLMFVGVGLSIYAPEARTLGEVFAINHDTLGKAFPVREHV